LLGDYLALTSEEMMSFDLLQWLDDAPIRLVSGTGNPETGGCWMSALSKYGNETWSDHPDCVCPIITRLCIACNDMLPDDHSRGRVIGPHILEPVGTRTDDAEIIEARRWHLVDAAVRVFAPHALDANGFGGEAEQLRSLPPVTRANASAAAEAAGYAAANAATYACYASHAAARAADAVEAAARAAEAASRAAYAAYATYAAAAADAAAREAFAQKVVLPVILELCEIGSKVPHEMACESRDFRRAVQCD